MNKKEKTFVMIIILLLLLSIFAYLFNENKILKKRVANLEKSDTALSEKIPKNTGEIANLQSQEENVSSETKKLAESVFDCSSTDGLSKNQYLLF